MFYSSMYLWDPLPHKITFTVQIALKLSITKIWPGLILYEVYLTTGRDPRMKLKLINPFVKKN